MKHLFRASFVLLFLSIFTPGVGEAAIYDVYPADDLFAVLDTVVAGDEVVVHEGTYSTQQSGGSWFRQLTFNGTQADPILIHAADGESVIIGGDPAGSQNIVNISGTWFTWAGFEMINGSVGLRVEGSSHAVFEDLDVHDTGDVGISCNVNGDTYEDITLRYNHVHHTNGTGECFYLGCNNGACVMFDSLIEYNHCHDTVGTTQGDGIELKTGSYNTIIRHNVIHDVYYPGITMYGTDGHAQNIVEGNVVWNTGDNGIQLVGDAVVRNNLVMNAGANGIHSKDSQGNTPHDLVIVNNTVVGAGDSCLRGNNWNYSESSSIIVANNALYCEGTTAVNLPNGAGSVTFSSNAVLGSNSAPSGTFPAGSVDADLLDGPDMQLYPTASSSLIDSADTAYAPDDDFNCLERTDGVPDVGAYEWSGNANPGWEVQADFKICSGSDSDADIDGDSDSDSDGGSESDLDGGDGSCGCSVTGNPSMNIFALALILF